MKRTLSILGLASIALLSVDLIVKIVQKIIPKKKESDMILAEKLNQELLKTPSFALESARFAIIEMSEFTLSMYNASIDYFNKKDEKVYDFINSTEEKVDLAEHSIHDYLMQISGTRMNQNDMILQTAYIDIIRDMERIADHAVNFGEFLHRYYDEKNIMTNEMHDALLKFFEVVKLQIIESIDAYKNNDKVLASKVILRENEVDKMEEEYRLNVHSFLKTGEVSQLDILFIDIVSNLERISDHTMNIAELIIDPHMMSTMITGEKI